MGWQRLRSWLGLERNIVVMLIAMVVVGMGEELWIRFLPKYMEALGATAWGVAVYGTMRELLDALYQYPGGWLSDRLGRRIGLVVFTLLAMVGYGIYFLSPNWQWVLVGTVFAMAWHSLTAPVLFAIIGDNLPPQGRSIGFGVQSALKRLPIVLAPPLGGWLVASLGLLDGVRLAIAVTLGLAVVAIAIALRYYKEQAPTRTEEASFGTLWRGMDPGLKRLLLADSLARWAEGIPKVFIVLYVLNVLQQSPLAFGWLTSLQMLTAILLYIPISKLSDRLNRKPFVLLSFAFFALFPLALAQATHMAWLALAFVVGGLREIGEPARKALIVDLAHEGAIGRSVGMYYMVRQFLVFPAALVGGWLWTLNPQWNLYAAFAIGVAGFLAHALWGPNDPPHVNSVPA